MIDRYDFLLLTKQDYLYLYMTINYSLDEKDFLVYQLYVASQSEQVKKKRRRNRILVPLAYSVFGILSFSDDNILLAAVFGGLAVLWFFMYPTWERRRYVKHYRNFINESYKDRFGKTASLEIANEYLQVKDNSSEGRVSTTELMNIVEIPQAIFIRIKGGQAFILPKEKIQDIAQVKERLKEVAAHAQVEYETNNAWVWK